MPQVQPIDDGARPPGHHRCRAGAPAEISAVVTGSAIRHVRSLAGEAGVAEVLRLAGEPRSAAELEDERTWSSTAEGIALFEAAATVVGDEDVARAAGECSFEHFAGSAVARTLRTLGSPADVLRHVHHVVGRFSVVTGLEAVEVEEERAVVAAWSLDGAGRHRTMCQFTAGVLSRVAAVFGGTRALVTEHECQVTGSERCVYEVRWDRVAAEWTAYPERRAARLQEQLTAVSARVDELYGVAADLAAAGSPSAVLARLTARAASAAHAPAHLLAVRLPTGAVEVHHHGFADDAADDAAAVLLDGGDTPPSWLVCDITSPERSYGRIAAVYPGPTGFLPAEEQLLAVYARFAATVLDLATALETARERDATARALLRLANALAEVGTPTEVAERLIAAVPAVVGYDQAAVFELDEHGNELRHVTSRGVDDELAAALERLVIRRTDSPRVAEMMDDPAPTVLHRGKVDPFLDALFHELDFGQIAVVPLTANGRFFGVLAAGSSTGTAPDYPTEQLVERLRGLADQGAVAFANALQLDETRHQAFHDPLTGLPNRRFLEDATTSAIAAAERGDRHVGLVFLDLDGFKAINDQRGHLVGDEVLRHLARRLETSVRADDTVARVSGDEFAVLLPRVESRGDVEAAARSVGRALQNPFSVDGVELVVGASVGVALAPDDATTYRDLLDAADAAMYRAKSLRRHRLIDLTGTTIRS